ncbi:hypothetical protein [Hymenobacter ruber]
MESTSWFTLSNQQDIDLLMQVFGRFHDSCIKQVLISTREYVAKDLSMGFDNIPTVKILFQRQFRNTSVIEISFEEVEEMNWRHDNLLSDTGLTIIMEAVLQIENGLVYWAEDIDWLEAGDERNDFRWIAARTVKWRTVEDALGQDYVK